jgi:hypothetical protein
MSVTLKAGDRFYSLACDTEVVVVKGSGEVDLRCGGEAMQRARSSGGSPPTAPFDGGTLVGKRYATEDESIELLCTRPGGGSLSIGAEPMAQKSAKPLPSSD